MKTLTIVLNLEQSLDLIDLLAGSDIEEEDDVLMPLLDGILSMAVETSETEALVLDVSCPI